MPCVTDYETAVLVKALNAARYAPAGELCSPSCRCTVLWYQWDKAVSSGFHDDLDYLRTFRNRIMHHVPIGSRHLSADHASIYRITGYLAPDFAKWVQVDDRVPELLAQRPAPCPHRVPRQQIGS
jgi:hypothetical protein